MEKLPSHKGYGEYERLEGLKILNFYLKEPARRAVHNAYIGDSCEKQVDNRLEWEKWGKGPESYQVQRRTFVAVVLNVFTFGIFSLINRSLLMKAIKGGDVEATKRGLSYASDAALTNVYNYNLKYQTDFEVMLCSINAIGDTEKKKNLIEAAMTSASSKNDEGPARKKNIDILNYINRHYGETYRKTVYGKLHLLAYHLPAGDLQVTQTAHKWAGARYANDNKALIEEWAKLSPEEYDKMGLFATLSPDSEPKWNSDKEIYELHKNKYKPGNRDSLFETALRLKNFKLIEHMLLKQTVYSEKDILSIFIHYYTAEQTKSCLKSWDNANEILKIGKHWEHICLELLRDSLDQDFATANMRLAPFGFLIENVRQKVDVEPWYALRGTMVKPECTLFRVKTPQNQAPDGKVKVAKLAEHNWDPELIKAHNWKRQVRWPWNFDRDPNLGRACGLKWAKKRR